MTNVLIKSLFKPSSKRFIFKLHFGLRLYAPTTLTPARDFWLLRYTSVLEDGSLVICERSLKNTQNGPTMPSVQHFVRAEMLPSGYLIRPCEVSGSIINIVDRIDLEPFCFLVGIGVCQKCCDHFMNPLLFLPKRQQWRLYAS